MDTLSTSMFNLKTLELRDLHQLIADLNFNFKQIMQLPGFKGIQGNDGDSITGAPGARGSIWIFAQAADFLAAYPSLTSANQVTMSFINSQLTSNLALVLATLHIASLSNNDVIVLPNRDVIQFNAATNAFEATGIRFADGFSLTVQDVTTIVNTILGNQTNADAFTTFQGVAKNYSDSSTGLNNELNQNSVVDINVVGSGLGVTSANHVFVAMKQAISDANQQFMMLTGSAKRYNALVQATQNALTNDYMPGIDDFGALAVMQNSYNNGIIIGHKNSATFATWGRIYRTENLLRLISDYHPTLNESARLDLGKTGSTLYSPKNLSLITNDGTFSLNSLVNGFNWITAQAGNMTIGDRLLPNFTLAAKDFIKVDTAIGANANVLSLQGGLLKASQFQPRSTSIVNDPFLLVTHNLLFDYATAVSAALTALSNRITALEQQSVYKQQSVLYTGSANTMTEFGFYILRRDGSSAYTNLPDTRLQSGTVSSAAMEVHRFVEVQPNPANNIISIKQIFSQGGNGDGYVEQYVRGGTSTNNGATFTFTPWTGIVDAYNYKITAGAKMVSTEYFTDSQEITISHAANSVTAVGDGNANLNVVKAVTLDATGHPQSAQMLDLGTVMYTKPEVNALLTTSMPIGSIIMWEGLPSTIPPKWYLCNGTNGTPALQGRFIVGYDAADTDYNNFSTVAARLGGVKRMGLLYNNMPAHTHTVYDPGHSHSFTQQGGNDEAGNGRNSKRRNDRTESFVTNVAATGIQINPAGNGVPFDNRPPYYVLCYIQYKGV